MAISATAANPAKSAKYAEISKSTKSTKLTYPPTLTPLVVQKLCAPIARKLGVKSLYLFGSVAQGTANRNSDVDFIYELQDESNLERETSRIVRKQELMRSLADCLGRKIDLVNKSYVTQPLADEDAEIQRKAFVTTINAKPIFQIV
ncbi:nucleotidyltransferase family protein [Gardnerella pickettii]|uniref:Nucleotidyltransferase domain protein n=1 Tax=Gardnerella pickettii JCP8017A TaxID=1261062 RepID=T2PJ62_9BIFI|nr:nucleotidyltransferase domain-containing protein [Gardnerella pickettii]MDK7785331.1 nucleotidyltransferase domain-containing protein [Bifidobacterium sp. UMB6791B]MDK8249165.1 nucleotidyltransferase domain-containing protein [Bifidobacterium sp. UMB6794B]MDK8635145.1 nucleotidyltransferase domain-containing protein [Bifidobacterium sp. UMB6791A]EPI49856.1 nucleotidyltransferase domain protein [Gardnerella pickettii JCP8017A]EPI59223.1 nucleotidyltransferase domain protein [Gardnerella pick